MTKYAEGAEMHPRGTRRGTTVRFYRWAVPYIKEIRLWFRRRFGIEISVIDVVAASLHALPDIQVVDVQRVALSLPDLDMGVITHARPSVLGKLKAHAARLEKVMPVNLTLVVTTAIVLYAEVLRTVDAVTQKGGGHEGRDHH